MHGSQGLLLLVCVLGKSPQTCEGKPVRFPLRSPGLWLGLVLFGLLTTPIFAGGARLGDWGHFLSYRPKIYLNNPEGERVSLEFLVMKWPVQGWNSSKFAVRIQKDGQVVFEGEVPVENSTDIARIVLETSGPGVYLVEPNVGSVEKIVPHFALRTNLPEAVLWTGDPNGHAIEGRRAVWQASVPRRWWFWVPEGTTRFTIRAQRAERYMSQREDWGFFVSNPRGQRSAVLWGQPPVSPEAGYGGEQVVVVEVEPGNAGRFWSLEVRLGDSHNYSNINFSLDGVPPYLSQTPEEWFDPKTGKAPAGMVYDETPFIQSARLDPEMEKTWPGLRHFGATPSLGDPDGVEILGNARFHLWNPEGRTLHFRLGTYLIRNDGSVPTRAAVQVADGKGDAILSEKILLEKIHENAGHPTHVLNGAPGNWRVEVEGSPERWMCFTYPATPLVLEGRNAADGWAEFAVSCGTVRNWYFLVPKGTKEFFLRFATGSENEVMNFEVWAPDRLVRAFYHSGEPGAKIPVPEGLDGKIWFFRLDVGGATVMQPGKERPRFLDINVRLGVRGIPPYLAPTREQFFLP